LVRVDDSTRRYQELLEKGIVVRNPSNNMNCENTLRISVGLPEENDRLIEALSSLS
jgi:histidinol-phosphate aminotransferase